MPILEDMVTENLVHLDTIWNSLVMTKNHLCSAMETFSL